MLSYFIRRILIVPPTLLVITLLVFSISRSMPGGPIERLLAEASAATTEGATSSQANKGTLGEAEIEEIEELYGFNQPAVVAYLQWLGAWPRESLISKKEFGADKGERITGSANAEGDTVEIVLKRTGSVARLTKSAGGISKAVLDTGESLEDLGWSYRFDSEADRQARYRKRNRLAEDSEAPGYKDRAVVFKKSFSGLLQGDLGYSANYGDSVLGLIWERVPIAAYFGLLSAFITYGVSLPLGVIKAINHRTPIDTATSILIFIGYSIPGFALGAILIVWLGVRMELFPIFGLTSPDFGALSVVGKVKDLAHHTVLPLACYVVSGFAFLTMMMKNNLMDNLAADYVKTAVSRGASFRRAVFGHAFKNSLIPIATSLGQLITIFVGGSMLIERVFDIQGFGLLGYQAILDRDYPIVMGTLTISSLLVLLGNILSDFIIATIDPRIKFK